MTPQEVIDIINENMKSNDTKVLQAKEIAIDLISKEIPLEVIDILQDFEGLSAGCPKCNAWVSDYRDIDRCHKCGQKLDWMKN